MQVAPSFCEVCLKDGEDLLKCQKCWGKFHVECVENGKKAKKTAWDCPDCVRKFLILHQFIHFMCFIRVFCASQSHHTIGKNILNKLVFFL